MPSGAVCSSEPLQLFNLKASTLKVSAQPLILSIRDLIRSEGPISFARFMEQALYHPAHGYYSSGRCTIGRRGDYFTSVSVGPLFGKMLAAQFAEIWRSAGLSERFRDRRAGRASRGVCDRRAGGAARQAVRSFLRSLRYRIVEPFPVLRQRQQGVLRQFAGKTEWCASLEGDGTVFRRAFFQRAGRRDAGAPARRRRCSRAAANGTSAWSSEHRAASRLCISRSPIRDCRLRLAKIPPTPPRTL